MNPEAKNPVAPTILTRDYDAPIELVFEAWTRAEHLQNWQVPFDGFKFEFAHADIRPGGFTLHKMTAPNGFEMWLKTEYRSVTPHTELAFVQYTSNEAGEFVPNPKMPDWPRNLLTTIKLEAIENKTRLQLIWQPIDPGDAEAQAFDQSRAEHGAGWGAGLEQLAAYLDRQRG